MGSVRHGILTDELVILGNMRRIRYLTDRELVRLARVIPAKSTLARRIKMEQGRRKHLAIKAAQRQKRTTS